MRKVKYYAKPGDFYRLYSTLEQYRDRKKTQNRLFYSLALEDSVFRRSCQNLPALSEAIQTGSERLKHYEDFAHDLFQCFYALHPEMRPAHELSETARLVSVPIFEDLENAADFLACQAKCRGNGNLSALATLEFSEYLADNIETLAPELKNGTSTTDILDKKEEQLHEQIARMDKLKEQYEALPTPENYNKASRQLAKTFHTAKQVNDLQKKAEDARQVLEDIKKRDVRAAVRDTRKKVDEAVNADLSWGKGAGGRDGHDIDLALLNQVRANDLLWRVSQHLGPYRELLQARRKNGYAYDRGERHDIILGRDIKRALTSEFSALAHPVTAALFLRKLATGRLRQYALREKTMFGDGDVVVCIDESSSMLANDKDAWSKAIACVVVEQAHERGRDAALIRFSRKTSMRSEVFPAGRNDRQALMQAVGKHYGGGTDFETPLTEAVRLMDEGCIKKADIVFITDGCCAINPSFCEWLHQKLTAHNASVLGVLLDKGNSFDFSLQTFCKQILRTSQMEPDCIASELIA